MADATHFDKDTGASLLSVLARVSDQYSKLPADKQTPEKIHELIKDAVKQDKFLAKAGKAGAEAVQTYLDEKVNRAAMLDKLDTAGTDRSNNLHGTKLAGSRIGNFMAEVKVAISNPSILERVNPVTGEPYNQGTNRGDYVSKNTDKTDFTKMQNAVNAAAHKAFDAPSSAHMAPFSPNGLISDFEKTMEDSLHKRLLDGASVNIPADQKFAWNKAEGVVVQPGSKKGHETKLS